MDDAAGVSVAPAEVTARSLTAAEYKQSWAHGGQWDLYTYSSERERPSLEHTCTELRRLPKGPTLH